MTIYLLLLAGLTGVYHLYFERPLAQLYYLETPGLVNLTVELELLIGATLGLGVVWLSRVLSRHFTWAKRIDEDFGALFAQHSSLQLTGLAAMSALSEEVLFRGVLLDELGLIYSALLFGGLHIPVERHHWPWSVAALIMGFAFGGVTLLTGSVTVALIAHFTINHFNLHALKALNFNGGQREWPPRN